MVKNIKEKLWPMAIHLIRLHSPVLPGIIPSELSWMCVEWAWMVTLLALLLVSLLRIVALHAISQIKAVASI